MFKKQRHLRMEHLEARELKAGDIAASLQSGNLILTEAAGQAGKDNAVVITRLSNGLTRVAGTSALDGGVSKVNGATYQDFRVTGSLNVSFGAGDDLVILGGVDQNGVAIPAITPGFTAVNIDVSAPAVVNASAAAAAATTSPTAKSLVATPPPTAIVSDNDNVIIWAVNVAGSMTINTGAGNDYVYVSNANIGTSGTGSLSINTGTGSDNVLIQNMPSFIPGSISVQMNGAASDVDTAYFDGVYAKGNIQVVTGAGNDNVNMLYASSYATIDVETGAGNDTVKLDYVWATNELMASLGDGNDSLNVDNLTSNRFDFDGGAGTNSLTFTKNLSAATSGVKYTLTEADWFYINGVHVISQPPVTAPISPISKA